MLVLPAAQKLLIQYFHSFKIEWGRGGGEPIRKYTAKKAVIRKIGARTPHSIHNVLTNIESWP